MLIDKMASDIHDKWREIISDSDGYIDEPKIVVYINYDFHQKLVAEAQKVKGYVSMHVAEFAENYTILGYPLFVVSPNQKHVHRDYEIMEVE